MGGGGGRRRRRRRLRDERKRGVERGGVERREWLLPHRNAPDQTHTQF